MRIKVLRAPAIREVDGISLRRFVPGQQYEVGNRIGALLLSEGWAEPAPSVDAALIVPLSELSTPFDVA